MDTDERALEYARRQFPDVNIIVSLYGLNVLWTSDDYALKLGYTTTELQTKTLRDIMVLTPEEIVKMGIEFIDGINIKDDVRVLVRKDGSHVEDTADVHLFTVDSEPFVAIVGSKMRPLP